MSYIEFLEALSRCAEKSSPAPFGYSNVLYYNIEWNEFWIKIIITFTFENWIILHKTFN